MNREALITGVADIVGIVFGLAILYGMLFENKSKTKRAKAFIICLCLMEFTLVGDALSWFLEGSPGYDGFLMVTNAIAVTACVLIVAAFSYYELEAIREKTKVSSWVILPVVICNVGAALVSIVGLFFGKIFTVKDGVFETQAGYNICLFASLLSFFYLFAVTTKYRKALGKHDTAAFYTYYTIPLLAALVELIPPHLELALVSSVLSLMIVYIMLQSSQVSEIQIRERIFEEFSYKDTLTGIKNRRAYETVLGALFGGKELGVVFCDVNGLKYMNDNFGHAAGDTLLTNFTKVMRKHLPEECCYRISGDEFVALMFDINRDEINRLSEALRAEVNELGEIASIGVAYGMTEEADAVIAEAEKHMYLEKTLFYVHHPEYDMRKNRLNKKN